MPTILLIEDNDLVRRSLRLLMDRSGFDVHEATDGEESIDLLTQNQYDLIVTDLVLPNMPGISLIEELRRISPTIPIVAISGGGSLGPEFLLGEAVKHGADAVFSKPIENSDFIGEIRDLLNSGPLTSTP